MPIYNVSFYSSAESGKDIERSYEAANADECLDQAKADVMYLFVSDEELASLDEIVVRSGKGDHRVERADGSTCVEIYWTTPQFRRRRQAQIAAIPGTRLAAVVNLLTESGIDPAQSPLAREYLKRKFRL
jgi:hypothetical protein